MNPLACNKCAARVDVAKYSPMHTSVQWNAEAAATCQEKAAADAAGHYLLRCSGLDASINDAARRGEIDLTLRSEPHVVSLSAPSARATA